MNIYSTIAVVEVLQQLVICMIGVGMFSFLLAALAVLTIYDYIEKLWKEKLWGKIRKR